MGLENMESIFRSLVPTTLNITLKMFGVEALVEKESVESVNTELENSVYGIYADPLESKITPVEQDTVTLLFISGYGFVKSTDLFFNLDEGATVFSLDEIKSGDILRIKRRYFERRGLVNIRSKTDVDRLPSIVDYSTVTKLRDNTRSYTRDLHYELIGNQIIWKTSIRPVTNYVFDAVSSSIRNFKVEDHERLGMTQTIVTKYYLSAYME